MNKGTKNFEFGFATWAWAYQGKSLALYKLKGEQLFSSLKADPRYAAFLKKMNLPLSI
jgi:hypothetical protein